MPETSEAVTTVRVDEQAEKLRTWLLKLVAYGARHGKQIMWPDNIHLLNSDGAIVLDDSEYTVHVLPAGELERLRNTDEAFGITNEEFRRQGKLIEEIDRETESDSHAFVKVQHIRSLIEQHRKEQER